LPEYQKKRIHYIIVPNTETTIRKEEERPFFLRLFTSEKIDLVKLPETNEQLYTGKWEKTTAGGRRNLDDGKENQFWCRNP